jgi:hypothetical protein
MKIKDVMVEMQKTSIDPQQAKLAELGRTLMDMAASHKDDVESNQMASLGSAMTEFGTPFGPNNLMDVVKRTGLDPKAIQKLMGMAQAQLKSAGPVRKAKDPIEQESTVREAYIKTADDAINVLAAIRKQSKQAELGQGEPVGPNQLVNDLYDVMTWIENNAK